MTATAVRTEVFQRSEQQRRDALVIANKVRVDRAALKRQVAAGEVSATSILKEPQHCVAGMKVEHLLVCVPKLGSVKARGMLNRCRISSAKTVGGISERQRRELVALLDGR